MTFIDIIELFPQVNNREYRVLMFQIPAAVTSIPTSWKNNYYARAGESLVSLPQYKIDTIRSQERMDWSKQMLPGATVQHLDKDAILLARRNYKEKMDQSHISEEVDAMSDEQFLTKIKLVVDGKVTNAAMVLLGNPDYDYLFQTPPSIPFINVVDKVFKKVRNLTYRYMPNQMTLFPMETQQYDTWLLRELLNNCIAHSMYQLGGRIYFDEFDDKIKISNPGDFIPREIESVLQVSYIPPFYKNQLLAEIMAKLHMIDTASMGIRKVFRIQKDKYFPMPDYDLSTTHLVSAWVYGKTLNDNYMHILFDHPELDLHTVFLLDQVRKVRAVPKEAIDYLRKLRLVEGRTTNPFLSSSVAKSIEDEVQYIKNKAFDDQYYKDMILEYIKKYGKAKKKDIRNLLWDKLPDVLADEQKEYKIGNLLASLKRRGVITTDSENQQKSYWVLSKS